MSGQIVEYSEGLDQEISLSLAEAEQEWKVKIVKKTKSAELSNYSGQSSMVVVPAFIDGNPVRKIGVFSSDPGTIEEVIIPPTVEMLTDKTFKKCSNLKKLTISKKTIVPFGAFDKCDSLCDENGCIVVGGVLHYLSAVGNVVITEGVKEIPDDFESCWYSANGKIKSIKFPESLIRIGKRALSGHKKLTQLVFPANLKEIDDRAFDNNPGLKSIEFNDGLEKLHGFSGAKGAGLNIKIPDTVSDFHAFKSSSIEYIKLPKGLKRIPSNCFSWCTNLKEIHIPDGVISIGDNAFGRCSSLSDVYIPDSVESIGREAFGECYSVSFHYNKHSMSFPGNAFIDCNRLTDGKGYQVFNDVLIKYRGNEEIIELPENIEKICNYSFKNNKRIKKVENVNQNVLLGEDDSTEAFKGCVGLADDNGFVIINNHLFDYLGNDKEIEVPSSVEFIASGCFTSDKVSKVRIPSSVKNIGKYAFDKEVEIEFIESVPFIPNQWVLVSEYDCTRTDDDNSSGFSMNGSCGNTLKWKQEKMSDGFFCIGDCLIYCDKTDSTLKIPQGIRSIASQALGGMFGVNAERDAVYIPEGVEYIALDALGKTKKIYLPETIKRIENLPEEEVTVFIHEGVDLDSILLDASSSNYSVQIIGTDSVTDDEEPTFVVGKMKSGGVRIKSYNGPTGKNVDLVIPSKIDGKPVTSIGKEAFKNKHFRRVELPDTVETIENDAFSLAEFEFIKLSSNLRSLESGAFEYHGFSFIDLPETLEIIKAAALDAYVAVFHGDPKITYNNTIVTYYADGENVKKRVSEVQTYAVELHSLVELDERYSEYRNCGVVVLDDDGRVKRI